MRVLLPSLTLCLALAGCGSFFESIGLTKSDAQKSYEQVLHEYTAQDSIIKELERRLIVTALYKSTPFRRAYAEKYINDYQLDSQQAGDVMATQTALSQNRLEFLLAVSTWNGSDNDLNERNSVWRIYLDGDSIGSLDPVEIKLVSKITPRMLGFFPFISPWDKVYEIRFDQPTAVPQGKLTLHVTGVIGAAQLNFNERGLAFQP